MKIRKIGVAVIGLGAMGYTDLEILKRLNFIEKIVGMDTDSERCSIASGKFDIKTTQNLSDIWNDKKIELVYITTPNRFHVPVAINALKAGKKVMMEKPMGVDEKQLNEILYTVRETRGFLQVGFECRNYSRLYLRMKEIIDSGEIGQVRHIHFTYCIQPFRRESWRNNRNVSGGLYAEKLCHYVDLPRWWIRKRVTRLFSIKAPNVIPYYNIPDNALSICEFEDGTISHLSFISGPAHMYTENELKTKKPTRAEFGYRGHKNSYLVVGTEGAMESSLFDRSLKVFYHQGKEASGEYSRLIRVERWKKQEDLFYYHNTTDQTIDIAKRAACGEQPAIDPEDAAETMRICFQLQKAADSDWKVIKIR